MLRPFILFICSGLLVTVSLLTRASLAAATPDPCAKISNIPFVDPGDALACLRSFPFNETLRQNVLSVVSRVFDFYTFEDFYLNSPPPFKESTTDIRAQIRRIESTQYETDYDFNQDLYDFTRQMNDGHTRWLPNCYMTFENILPAPIVILDTGVFIISNSVELFSRYGDGFSGYFTAKGFDWERLAGAEVIEIGGLPVRQYIDKIASTVSGNFLDHNVRVNSVVSGYHISGSSLSQRLGDHASELFLKQTSLNFSLIPVGSTSSTPEQVNVPFVALFGGNGFSDGPSYWANNCAATNTTNGAAITPGKGSLEQPQPQPRRARAALVKSAAIEFSDASLPTLTPTNGSTGTIKSYILPGNKTGVMFVGNFGLGEDFNQFPIDVDAAINQFKASGVEKLLIDVTNNPGGYLCLGLFLHRYLAGAAFELAGFQSTSRANPLARKIVKANIEKDLSGTYYAASNWLFPNGTEMSGSYNYNNPSIPLIVNGRSQPTSQRFLDKCPDPPVPYPSVPPFDLNNVVIVGNGCCASTCAIFTTAMFERHNTKIATFGGFPDKSIEFKGSAGHQVFDWSDLDTEIKTAGLKDDPLAPPDLLVNGNMRHNWRTAYSSLDETAPIAYLSETPQYHFRYTKDTYNNPENLWTSAEGLLFAGGG